jgi:hypothetical protein
VDMENHGIFLVSKTHLGKGEHSQSPLLTLVCIRNGCLSPFSRSEDSPGVLTLHSLTANITL